MWRIIGRAHPYAIRWYSIKPRLNEVFTALSRPDLQRWNSAVGAPILRSFIDHHLYKAESLPLFRTLTRKLVRQYGNKFEQVSSELPSLLEDGVKRKFTFMILKRHGGRNQYESFVSVLRYIKDSGLSNEDKKLKIYYAFELQNALYPKISQTKGVLVPDDIHRWFQGVLQGRFFDHYYFLIKNNVLLQSKCPSELMRHLLKSGSELDSQLASFQLFLYDKLNREIFDEKIAVLYNFQNINTIVNYKIQRKDFRFMQEYLEAMTKRLESQELTKPSASEDLQKLCLAKYTNTMLSYAKASNNPKLFADTFTALLSSLPGGMNPSFLHSPIKQVITYLRENDMPKHVFKIVSLLDERSDGKSNIKFKNHIMGNMLTTLRSFKNSMLSVSYVLRTFRSTKTKYALNQLGLWSLIFHNKVEILPKEVLESKAENQQVLSVAVPEKLTVKGPPDNFVLYELYKVVLDEQCKLDKLVYRRRILKLYEHYKKFLGDTAGTYWFHQLDATILRLFLYKIRFELRDDRLSYEVLTDFYRNRKLRLKCASGPSPFGVMLYKNESLNQTEINQVLSLMAKCKAPLDFYTIVTMVFRYAAMGDVDGAHQWYLKLIGGHFQIKNRALILLAKEHGWELTQEAATYLEEQTLKANPERRNVAPDEALSDSYFEEDDNSYADLLVKEFENLINNVWESKNPHKQSISL